MKKKHLLTAVLVIILLAAAFFWGGNYQEKEIEVSGGNAQAQPVYDDGTYLHGSDIQENDKSVTRRDNSTGELDSEEEERVSPPIKTEEPAQKDSQKKAEKKAGAASPGMTAENKTGNKAGGTVSQEVNEKDKYQTDPVPEGKPEPVEWQSAKIDKQKQLTCVLSVTCKTILDNMDRFNKDKLEVLPADGIIYKSREVGFYEGESVFDVLLREMKSDKIHMEFEMTPIYNSNYIEGIHNLYEFDCGELSGWMYRVNGWFPNYGCSRYMLKDGDVVEWIYTCDLGRDIGGGKAVGGKG
ncbi:uncharacterized protein DUF4430 [Ruminiclostridium sufflavum DSM 19573]|uniref:Uncharacterized protein DUF4430 n=1 Tax=Ruminiclostridium sufflavum DSM 19573 TaxID=1121337 RepID=A0A318XK35_9FIRM|nr:DUF4430 domain-containing protein [Ruminiclostridium sufflavum]PYG87393.1 uncharacterized protein DUF4430 [Ruminiclostridium sufflavum DSM 19573]